MDFRMSDTYTVHAVRNVSFSIHKGEIFGLVGESGSGKSTIARLFSGIYRPTKGNVYYKGVIVNGEHAQTVQQVRMRKEVQIVFQDSTAALNPRMTVLEILEEPLRIQHLRSSEQDCRQKAEEVLEKVGLRASYLEKHPSELSGGQCQRVAIARTLMMRPRLIIADEPIASMDVSLQAQIVNLFRELQREQGFSMLFIAHDLGVIRYLSDTVGVMLDGKLVEIAPKEKLFREPLHPYTQSLLSAMHIPDPIVERQKTMYRYDRGQVLGTHMELHDGDHYVLCG